MLDKTLGDYQIVKQLGQGSLGTIYLAEHRFLKKQFALKVLSEHLSKDRGFIKRFEEDVAAIAMLDHPGLVKIHNVSFAEGCYFLVSDCVVDPIGEPTTLGQWLAQKDEGLSEEEILSVLRQIGSALDYAHSKRVKDRSMIHRGIKFSNVLMGRGEEEPKVLLSDFGLSRIVGVGAVLTRIYRQAGEALSLCHMIDEKEECEDRGKVDTQHLSTLHQVFLQNYLFLAPEQKAPGWEKKVGIEADIYAFGVLAYYLLCGFFPEGVFPMPGQVNSELKFCYDDLIKGCLQIEPSRRPKALSALIQEVENSVVVVPIEQKEFAKQREQELTPVLARGEVNIPVYEPDPAAALQVDTTVKTYQPEPRGIKEHIEPILTEMVVVHGGKFLRGSSFGNRDEMPQHEIELESFAVDIHPVTNEQFVLFLDYIGAEKDGSNNDIIRLRESRIKRRAGKLIIESGYSKHPVVGVTWYGATAYAKWIGKRLPTEAEWEVGASSGDASNFYPTGEEIEKNQANYFSADTTAVMSYQPNSLGIYDMAGNVYEWNQDWYAYNYYETSQLEPYCPEGPLQGTYRVLRGGCWKSLKEDLRCSHRHRNKPGTFNSTYGFRCAADVK